MERPATDPDARHALAGQYAVVFGTAAGGVVIADLDERFGGNPFDAESDRMTSYRCGALAVIAHILEQIGIAQQQQAGTEPRQEIAQ